MTAPRPGGKPAHPDHAQSWLYLALAFACVIVTAGCGPTALYDWGQYEDSLQASYVAHDEVKAQAALEATITSAQQTGRRVPPGVCAEYGFLLYKRGQPAQAIQYFEQEARLFPESKPLMDKLITKVRQQAAANMPPSAGGGSLQ
ncbi:MAG: DUF4810 domain-containing protein [Deltaproteobacteria bacterium]|nr:DUF4810 domain-containing protein [Deltaproteobacteria bacterium]